MTKEIAHALDDLLRDYDLAGRFGGEEFSLLLPQTRAVDAFRIAERVQVQMISTTRGLSGTKSSDRGADGGDGGATGSRTDLPSACRVSSS